MARPLRVEFPGALYLVTARAMGRQRLFRGEEEAADFAGRFPALADAFGAVFHGYCLLPNHYHLLLETPRANAARVLHRLNSGYTATVNARRKRTGPLLQSRYRSILLEEDPWLLRLSVHIHLNPVRRKVAADPWVYPFSSAPAYGPEARPVPGLETGRVLALAGGREAYVRLVREGISQPPAAPWKDVWRQTVLGGEALRKRVLSALEGIDVREIAGFTEGKGGLGLEEVLAVVGESSGLAPEDLLRGKFQRVLGRKIAIYLARRFTALTLREIGRAFGVDYTTVHMAARRVEELRAEDPGVAGLVASLEGELSGRQAPEAPEAPEAPTAPAPVPEAPSVPRPRRAPRAAKPPPGSPQPILALDLPPAALPPPPEPLPQPPEAPPGDARAEVSEPAPPEETVAPEPTEESVPAQETPEVEAPPPQGPAKGRGKRKAGRDSAQLKLF